MTHLELAERAGALLGRNRWRAALGRLAGVHYATAKRWASGEIAVPAYVETIIGLMERLPTEQRPVVTRSRRRSAP